MEKLSFIVGEEEANLQVKKVIRSKYRLSSRMMTKIKYQDLISINGVKSPGYTLLNLGDEVIVSIPDEKSNFPAEDIPIFPIYEDEDFLIINKQAGVTVHPTKGHPSNTIANGLMSYMEETGQSFKVRFVNRLDMDTSGVLVIAKNQMVQADLNKQMMNGDTNKEYLAIVSGIPKENKFIIDLPIGAPEPGSIGRRVVSNDEDGFPSQTEVTVLATIKKEENTFSLLKINLLTGRTHQIRVHLSHLGFPLLGDPLYGGDMSLINRQALHAYRFKCIHPLKQTVLDVKAPLPEDLKSLLQNLGADFTSIDC